MMRTVLLIGMAAVVSAGAALAEQWPAWRGPRGDGTSEEKNIPIRWSATKNIAWKTAIPGKGHSSPVVWGDRIFVTTCHGQGKVRQRTLLAIDRTTGKILWQRVVLKAPLEPKNKLNSYASSTPATDGKHVWVTFLSDLKAYDPMARDPKVHVVCYDMTGKEIWRKSPGRLYAMHGFCSSLLPYKDLIILNADQDARGKDRAYIVAMEKATGKERWRIDRANRIRSYTPPVVFKAAGKDQMVVSGAQTVASYDPGTGKQHWTIDGPTEQFAASMVYTDGVFMITGGYPTLHILGIRPDGKGNVTKTHVLWHVGKNPSYVPSPIAAGKYFFLVSDKGTASCLEAKTGKYMWQQKLGRHHSASPVSAGGNLYFLDDDGVMFVLKASPKFELITKNDLGEDCRASPAISGGQIFIRAVRNLYCIGAKR